VYFPFVRAQDKAMLAEEQGEEHDDSPNVEQYNATMKDEEGTSVLHN